MVVLNLTLSSFKLKRGFLLSLTKTTYHTKPKFFLRTKLRANLSTAKYLEVSLRIQSECGKIRTRKTPNTDTFNELRPCGFTTLTPGVH